MAIDTIGNLELDIARQEDTQAAQGRQGIQQIGRAVAGSVDSALKSAEVLQANEVNVQKQKEFDQLLSTGAEGIGQYATELGIDPTQFVNMANNIQDPKKFADLYVLMKRKADKDGADKNRLEVFGTAKEKIAALTANTEATDDDFDRVINELSPIGLDLDPEGAKQFNTVVDNLQRTKAQRSKSRADKGLSAKAVIDTEDKMRKEFKSTTKAKRESVEFVDKALNLSRQALKNPSGKNAAADIALIMSFNKILDPGSVVREGEYDRVEKAQGVINWIGGLLNSMTESGGAKLTDPARRNLVEAMDSMKKLSELNIIEQGGDLISIGSERGLNTRAIAPSVFRKHPEEAELMLKAFSSVATEEDKQAWGDKRIEILNKAIAAASRAASIQGVDANYTGEDKVSGVSQSLGIDASPTQFTHTTSSPQKIGRFNVTVKGQ